LTNFPVKSPRKLIEVALPLDAINEACAYEKLPGIGPHPRGIHLWWARRPLAAARAVLFAQLVNDPGTNIGQGFRFGINKKDAAIERQRLFKILEELAQWKNTHNEELLAQARSEIRKSWVEVCELNKDHPEAAQLFNPNQLPAFHDPFAGGGAIPLEAQRLGLESFASDLNPVAVLINKSMIEIPSKFVDVKPIGPSTSTTLELDTDYPGIEGLTEDIRRYGAWIEAEAQNRLGHLYQPVEITSEMANGRPDLAGLVGKKLEILTWLWARTVKSPNPAFSHVDVPLTATFCLSTKKGKQAYLHPVVENDSYTFVAQLGELPASAKNGTKASDKGANFRCILSGAPISADYIRNEAANGRMGQRLLVAVCRGPKGKLYISPTKEIEEVAEAATPGWKPEVEFAKQALGFRIGNYGMSKWSDLFTPRQLTILSTFSDLVIECREKAYADAIAAGFNADDSGLETGGKGAKAYAEAISVYLAFAISRLADYGCALTTWKPSGEQVMQLFNRGAISMKWDFAESNLLGKSAICWANAVKYTYEGLRAGEAISSKTSGHVLQADARVQVISQNKIISTDPPYYDNIGYADLSDFFYVWLRRSLRAVFPQTLATITVPKNEELVATPFRHGGDEKAENFFLNGMTDAIKNLADLAHPQGPVTIYYAFKQSETEDESHTSSTGWDTFLNAVISGGFAIAGTWPLRSEQEFRLRGMGANALASSILLVCRKREISAPTISRREFLRELNAVLPEALDEMTKGLIEGQSPVAPVDLSQAIIGPGMSVFSKYSAVLEADGTAMNVRTALQLINRFLAEDDFDRDTQFCLHWFEQNGWKDGSFGEADTLARAKGTSVEGVREAGVVHSGGGVVRVLKWSDYKADWDPQTDTRIPIWETLHHLIRALKQEGETGAGKLLSLVKPQSEAARQLAYRLYTLCERQGWAEDARAYNELITSWTGIETAAAENPAQKQLSVFE
jgi:putative DNA methylase